MNVMMRAREVWHAFLISRPCHNAADAARRIRRACCRPPALGDPWFTCVLALVPNVHPVIGAPGALARALPDVLRSDVRDVSALHAAIASPIGTDTGKRILPTWAEVALAGEGAAHAVALTDAVHDDRCIRRVAAAPIGPGDASATLPPKHGTSPTPCGAGAGEFQ